MTADAADGSWMTGCALDPGQGLAAMGGIAQGQSPIRQEEQAYGGWSDLNDREHQDLSLDLAPLSNRACYSEQHCDGNTAKQFIRRREDRAL